MISSTSPLSPKHCANLQPPDVEPSASMGGQLGAGSVVVESGDVGDDDKDDARDDVER